MKKILFLTGAIALITTTGCVFRDDGRREHTRVQERHEDHREVILAPPVVEVRPPEVIVR